MKYNSAELAAGAKLNSAWHTLHNILYQYFKQQSIADALRTFLSQSINYLYSYLKSTGNTQYSNIKPAAKVLRTKVQQLGLLNTAQALINLFVFLSREQNGGKFFPL